MKITIERKIFERYIGVNIGVIIAHGLQNKGESLEIQNLLRQQETVIRNNSNLDSLGQDPKITVWRKAYLDFGAKPKEHRSSVENLYKLVLEGICLKHINNLVDIYNLISLKHMLPAGGEDLDQVQGDIQLTLAKENEPPVLLLGDKEARPPHIGEVIYKDGLSAICRRWNWREADRTKLTEQTKNCILVIEGISPIIEQEIQIALEELKSMVEKYCGGNLVSTLLNKNNSQQII